MCSHVCRVAAFALPGLQKTAISNRHAVICRPAQAQRRLVIPEDCTFLGFASSPRGEVWGEGKVNAKLCSHFCRVAAFALPGLQKTAISNRHAVICRPAQAQRRRAIPEDCTFLGFAPSPRGEVWGEGKVNAKLCSHFCRVAAFALPGLQKTAISNRHAVICRPAQAQRRRAIPEDCTFLGFAPSPRGEVWGEGKVNAKLCSHFCRVAAFALPGLQKTAISNRHAVICRPAQAQRRRAIPEDCTFLGFAPSPRGEVWGEGKVNAKLCSHVCRVAAFALPGLQKTAISNRHAVICRPAQAQRRRAIPEECTF